MLGESNTNLGIVKPTLLGALIGIKRAIEGISTITAAQIIEALGFTPTAVGRIIFDADGTDTYIKTQLIGQELLYTVAGVTPRLDATLDSTTGTLLFVDGAVDSINQILVVYKNKAA